MDSNYFVEIKGLRFGFQRSPIVHKGVPYMTRYIVYLGWICLRAHRFFRGDDDRAPHDHPFWFVTVPLCRGYWEKVPRDDDFFLGVLVNEFVRGWRPHFRPAAYQHIVKGAPDGKPFWSIVIAGRPTRMWGFWPRPDKFVPWREWT